MRSVVLIHALLKGMGWQEPCELLAIRESGPQPASPRFNPIAYSRCSVIDTPPGLPDGDYTVTFGAYIVPARKEAGLWVPDSTTVLPLAPALEDCGPSPAPSTVEADAEMPVPVHRVA